jgi:hypothetical protein
MGDFDGFHAITEEAGAAWRLDVPFAPKFAGKKLQVLPL